MLYRIRKYEIHSENAAKPTETPSTEVLAYIAKLEPKWSALDLGCGKLRYTIPLAKRLRRVVAVDSRIQLERRQSIAGESGCTVLAYLKQKLPRVVALDAADKRWLRWRFDFVLLSHVLSSIPQRRDRLRLLRQAASVLKLGTGRILLITNYANTRFRDWGESGRAERCRDGWLVGQGTRRSFFGLIPLDTLRRYCRSVGLQVRKAWTSHGEVAYVEACLSAPAPAGSVPCPPARATDTTD